MSDQMIAKVLAAQNWHGIGYPKTKTALRKVQAECHPDVNSNPNATEAFTKLETLYTAPEIVW